MAMHKLSEWIKIHTTTGEADIPPQTVNGATVNGFAWRSMAKYEKCAVLCVCGSIDAGGVVTFTLQEAIGAGGTPLAIAGKTAVFADDEDNTAKTIELRAEEMTVNSRYDHVRIIVVESGTENAVCCAVIAREGCRYPAATLPA